MLPSFLREGAWGQLIAVTMDGSESQTGTKRDVREKGRETDRIKGNRKKISCIDKRGKNLLHN